MLNALMACSEFLRVSRVAGTSPERMHTLKDQQLRSLLALISNSSGGDITTDGTRTIDRIRDTEFTDEQKTMILEAVQNKTTSANTGGGGGTESSGKTRHIYIWNST